MSVCPTCGKSLLNERAMRQHHSKVHNERLPNNVCDDCGKDFYHKNEKKYCDACFSMEGDKNPNYRDAKVETNCKNCGESFEYYESNKIGVYCSDCVDIVTWGSDTPSGEENPAWNDDHDGFIYEGECDWCGEKTTKRQSRDRGFCSDKCMSNWMSEFNSGENNPMWNGGYDKSWYNNKKWKNVRDEARERDSYECQRCGSDETLDVHHIKPVRTFEDYMDAHTIDNVITLCRSCHRKVEVGEATI